MTWEFLVPPLLNLVVLAFGPSLTKTETFIPEKIPLSPPIFRERSPEAYFSLLITFKLSDAITARC